MKAKHVKYNFDEIVRAIPFLSEGEKETLEIMLNKNLHKEILERNRALHNESMENKTFSPEEIINEIERESEMNS